MNLFLSACYSWTPCRLILVIVLQLWWNGLPSSLHFCLSPFCSCLSSLAFQHWKEHTFFLLLSSNRFVQTVFRCRTLVMPMAGKQCQRNRLRKKCRQKGFFYVHSAAKNFLKSVGKMQVRVCDCLCHMFYHPQVLFPSIATLRLVWMDQSETSTLWAHITTQGVLHGKGNWVYWIWFPSFADQNGLHKNIKTCQPILWRTSPKSQRNRQGWYKGKAEYRHDVAFLNIIQTLL